MIFYLIFLVLGLAMFYAILHWSGMLDELGQRRGGNGGGGQQPKLGLDGEIERRLKVFEDYLKDTDESPDDTS